jgi:hypothetical protein
MIPNLKPEIREGVFVRRDLSLQRLQCPSSMIINHLNPLINSIQPIYHTHLPRGNLSQHQLNPMDLPKNP